MEIIAPGALARIAGASKPNDNMRATCAGLDLRGTAIGLDRPHRLAHYLGQLAHESGRWRYDREVWGPTPAQRRYDTRTDLGKTADRDGDGERYRGRGPIQITGRANYAEFTAWARAFDPAAPDFAATPDAINTAPWEGLVGIWYWEARRLNRYADEGDAEMISRRINGGLNGYADRLTLTDRASLTLLGREPGDITGFQREAGLKVDGISGPRTRAAIHTALVGLPPLGTPARPGSDLAPAPHQPVPGSTAAQIADLITIRDASTRALARLT